MKKISAIAIVCFASWMCCPPSSGQTRFQLQGSRVEVDSAAVVQIGTYRTWRLQQAELAAALRQCDSAHLAWQQRWHGQQQLYHRQRRRIAFWQGATATASGLFLLVWLSSP